METPIFTFRLPAKEAKTLRDLAAVFYDGAPNMASQFVRELLRAAMSLDNTKVAEFFTRLQVKITGQLEFELKAAQDRGRDAEKPPLKVKRKGGRHGRYAR